MYRSPAAKRLCRAGLAGLLALVLVGVARPAAAINEIWSLDVDSTEIVRKNSDGTQHRVTNLQDHYAIRFESDENFVFIIPKEFMGRGRRGVFSDGSTRYFYREAEGEPWIVLWIANRVLAYREAFLAAEEYFADAAKQAGLTLRFWSDDPIKVVIGESQPGSAADAAFWRHNITMKPTSSLDPHVTAVHEYFHFVQDAVWYSGDEDDFWQRYTGGGENPFRLYMDEMTAEWATDEPIRVNGVGGRPSEILDAKNDYLNDEGAYFLDRNTEPFFQTDEYETNLFIKYLAEQIAGKKDESAAAQVLTLIARMYERGGLNRENFFQVIAEMVPSRDFGAPTWPQRWSKFFRAFSASNVVQRGASLEDPKAPAGYWDDAFTALTSSLLVDMEEFRLEEASRHSDRVYAEPARDDTERRQRLEKLIGEDQLVEALSYRVHRLDLSSSRSRAAARPVFLMARGVPGTDLFLLGQRYPSSDTYYDRKQARFSWHPDFTFSDQGETHEPRVYYEFPAYNPGTGSEVLWVGLVNSGTNLKSKVMAWAYQASPRIISRGHRPIDGGTETVRLVGGSAFWRANPEEGFYNGDTFELEIRTTGPLHRQGADLNRLAPEDVAARLRVLDEHGAEILLDTSGGEPVEISVTRTPEKYSHYWTYKFSGKFAEENPVTGKGRFEIKITSPLNMGGDDREVDDSYAFTLRDKHPQLLRLVISSDVPEILYDSKQGLSRIPVPSDDTYVLDIEATFSLPMLEDSVEITAGRESPFDSYRVGRVRCREDDKICSGRLTVPVKEVPASGMLLRLAVGGESEQAERAPMIIGRLDADPVEPGPQPDIRHYVLLGVKEIYRLSQSAHAFRDFNGEGSVDIGPIGFEIDLYLSRMDQRFNNYYVRNFERSVDIGWGLLDNVKKAIKAIEKQYKDATDDPEEYAEGIVEALNRRRTDMKEAERKGQGPGPEAIAQLEKRIDAFEARDEEELGKELAENRRLALERQRSRRAFLEGRYLPLVEAAHRVMNGFKVFGYVKELSGPFPFSFDGVRSEVYSSGGPYSEDWPPPAGVIKFQQSRLTADGWSVDDLLNKIAYSRLGRYDLGNGYPELYVWDFWPSDLAKVQKLLDLRGRYPDSFAKPPGDGMPEMIVGGWDEYQADLAVKNIAGLTDRDLTDMCRLMWSFFRGYYGIPGSELPPDSREGSNDPAVNCDRLPLVDGTRLVRLRSLSRVRGLPLHIEGYQFELEYYPDSEDTNLVVHPPKIDESTGFRAETLETEYRKGSTLRTNLQVDATFDWTGFTYPPNFFTIPSINGDYSSGVPGLQDLSIVDSNSRQTLLNNHQILIQTTDEVAHGTLRGQNKYNTRWDVRYRIQRIGETPAPDPNEPLPAWTEPGEEPRLEPKPKPVSEKPKPKKPRQASASSYDPNTGITTTARRNPDGSVTVTQTDRGDKVISTKTRPAQNPLPSASVTDPQSGITTSAARTPDGATRISRTDSAGKLLSERLVEH